MKPVKYWKVEAEGDCLYVRAPDKRRAVEVVETFCGCMPGVLQMEVTETVEVSLPVGERWLS